MPSVRLERLAFAYADAAPILSKVDLVLPPGFTALVGENGAGKSTLLALVAGALAPDAGRVRLEPEGAAVAVCPQEVHRRGADVAALAGRDDGDARRLRASLALAPEELARWETLSPGERKRWQIGAALAAEPDVLLLDEPTNHADAAARAHLVAALRGFRGVGVVVSHDRALLEAIAPRTLRLHRGEARLWYLPYGAARAAWEAELRAAWDRRGAAQDAARVAAGKLDVARRAREAADRARSGRHRDPKDRDARTLVAKTLRDWAEDRLGGHVNRLRSAAQRAGAAIPDQPPDEPLGRAIFLGFERAPRPVVLSLDADVVRAGPAPMLRDVHVRLGREGAGARRATAPGRRRSSRRSSPASTLPPARLLHLPQELPAQGEGARLLDEVRALAQDVKGRVLSLVAALGSNPAGCSPRATR